MGTIRQLPLSPCRNLRLRSRADLRPLAGSWVHPCHSLPAACLLSPPRRGPPTARGQQLPPRAQETRALHQGAAEGAREGVCGQQVHHQREAPAHLGYHEPLGAPGHHLVPEPAGQREEGGQQIKSAPSSLYLTAHPAARPVYLCRRFVPYPNTPKDAFRVQTNI